MAERSEIEGLLDAFAQALVLVDPADPRSIEDIRCAGEALSVWAGARGVAPEDVGALISVTRRCAGAHEPVAEDIDEIERRFASLCGVLRAAGDAVGDGTTGAVRSAEMPLAADDEMLADFVDRAREHLVTAEEHLLVLEHDPGSVESLDAVFRAFHTIKGMAGFLALDEIGSVAHRTETVLEGPRRGGGPLDPVGFETVFAALDEMRVLVDVVADARRGSGETSDASPGGGAGADAPVPAPGIGGGATFARRGDSAGSVRIDEERLDRLLDMIGELVIGESMFSEAVRRETGRFGVLSEQLTRLDKITRELQEMATSLRMVTLRTTFVHMARLVRDLSYKSGKPVQLVASGDETELDKSVVDRIQDPLVHVIRNAVDHGIESPAERRSAGKPETARVGLRAFHAGGRIHIEVTDDGRGLDDEAVLAAARARGLIGPDDHPSRREIADLVFHPGLSTSATVSEVSGRGVGMDVVRSTINDLRGEVELESTPGEGTRLSIRLPLTLAIIDGIIVRVGGERYAIPTLSIERSVRADRSQLATIAGRGEVMQLDHGLVPLLHLDKVFGIPDSATDPAEGIVVIVDHDGQRVGLVASEILGQQQIVIKSLGEAVQDTPGITGGAIMPDGTVGLIVDVGALVRLARA